MKRATSAATLLTLLACTSIAPAQDWMSWKSEPAQQPAQEPAISSAQSPVAATVETPEPDSTVTVTSGQVQRSTSAADNGIIGNPTPALALYVAQVEFAHKSCGLDSTKQNSRFYEWAARRGLMLDEYRKKDEDFSRAEHIFLKRFQDGWLEQSEDQKTTFCDAYADDVKWAKDSGRLKILNVSDRFRSHFAPLSQQRIERAQKARLFAGVISLGFSAAGVNQTRQQDFSTASQFRDYSAAFAHLINDPHAVGQTPCESYLPFLLANIKPEDLMFDTYYSIRECSIQ